MRRLSSVSCGIFFCIGLVLAHVEAEGPIRQAQGREETVTVRIGGEAGPYTVERWKGDWPGCEFQDGIKEGHASVVLRGNENWLRVNYAVGEIGPEKGGVGWRWPMWSKEQGAEGKGKGVINSAELRYTVRFGKDFDWVKGGKLPGLCGGPENVSGGRPANGTNGFSARLMWRREGRGEAYVYHKNQATNYGDRFSFPEDFVFPTEKEVHVRMQVVINAVGKKDGSVRVWIAVENEKERLLVERTDVEFRGWRPADGLRPAEAGTFGVDSVYFETFHGGHDKSWAPSRPCWAEFGKVRVTKG